MIELSGIIESGNYAFSGHPTRPNSPSEISLTGDTEIRGGNFVLAHITTNGFALTLTGGNCRGLRTRTNPADAWVKQDSFVWQRKEPLAKAATVLASIRKKAGTDGLEIWQFAVSFIFVNPTISKAELLAELDAWGNKTGNYASRPGEVSTISPATALTRIISNAWPGKTFIEIRDDIVAHEAGAWAGEATETTEEYS